MSHEPAPLQTDIPQHVPMEERPQHQEKSHLRRKVLAIAAVCLSLGLNACTGNDSDPQNEARADKQTQELAVNVSDAELPPYDHYGLTYEEAINPKPLSGADLEKWLHGTKEEKNAIANRELSYGTSHAMWDLYRAKKLGLPEPDISYATDDPEVVDKLKYALEEFPDDDTAYAFYACEINPVDGDYLQYDACAPQHLTSPIDYMAEDGVASVPVELMTDNNYQTGDLDYRKTLEFNMKAELDENGVLKWVATN